MAQGSNSYRDGLTGLRTLLMALEQCKIESGEPVEILICVLGKEDRTLKMTLSCIDTLGAISYRSAIPRCKMTPVEKHR